MNLESWLTQVLQFTGSFNIQIAVMLFVLCAIGEIGIAIPYILETVWLLSGFQLARGILSPVDMFLIWLSAQTGRQMGSLVLYYSGILSINPASRLYKKYIEPRLPKKLVVPYIVTKPLRNPSTFSVAAGRLLGLRLPVALSMCAKKRLSGLAAGVLLSSLLWDGVFIGIGGTVGVAATPQPLNMLLYSLGGLTLLYLVTLGIRYIWRLFSMKYRPSGKINLRLTSKKRIPPLWIKVMDICQREAIPAAKPET